MFKKRASLFLVIGMGFLVIVVPLFFFVHTAMSAVPPDANFRVVMPYAPNATQGRDVYMEIAQVGSGEKGNGNRLDAGDSWSKFYIDQGRLSDATLGIYNGGYGGAVDSLGFNSAGANNRFADKDAVKYEFYLGMNDLASVYDDEIPCRIQGEYQPSLTRYSGDMPVQGWYKGLQASEFSSKTCNGKAWTATNKSGKYVIFMKASWATSQPSDANGKLGRLNAFKVGAAYSGSGTPLTGYWSDIDAATSSNIPQRAAYSLQDRVSADKSHGNYNFDFGTDCRLSVGQSETRYLHWKDVDYPDYYAGEVAPEFTLYDIDEHNVETKVYTAQHDKKLPNGTYPFNGEGRENVTNYYAFTGKGGHTYRWEWKDVTRIDGISFWLPYDDFPAINPGGCGKFNYGVGLQAGVGAPGNATSFEAYGGQSVAVKLTPLSTGPNAGPDYNLNLKTNGSSSINSGFSSITATVGGHTVAQSTNARELEWTNLPRMGPSTPYSPTRADIFATFKVSEDAPDGAQYCFTASISPHNNTDSGPFASVPPQVCFKINNSLRPYLTTSGGDVHAGDCNVASAQPNNVIGQGVSGSLRGSSGSYIVSAGDNITQFGSGGSPGSTNLNFGKTGFYGTVCRPTLQKMKDGVTAAINAGGVTVLDGDTYSSPFNLGQLTAGKRYVVKFANAGFVTGTSKALVTIMAGGKLTIQGSNFGSDTSAAAAASRSNLPVVGVIAQSIAIKKEVDGVTAQLYATGNIDTCSDDTAANCRKILFLRGFAMAGDFSFKRSGTGQNGLQQAELFGFNAAFYLNPPPGFGLAAGTVKYLGERAPLY